jgi:hypothetical protein
VLGIGNDRVYDRTISCHPHCPGEGALAGVQLDQENQFDRDIRERRRPLLATGRQSSF